MQESTSGMVPLILEDGLASRLGQPWRAVSDQVMGGLSSGAISRDQHAGRDCLRLSGEVSLENNGGFLQMALDLAAAGQVLDASARTGLQLTVSGNEERYGVHLRTADNVRPWQSYRCEFLAPEPWVTVKLPFTQFVPHRTSQRLNLARLSRVGLVAIGRAFTAELRLAELALY